MATWMQVSSFLPLLIAIIVYIYTKNKRENDYLDRVLTGLLEGERSVNISEDIRVAVGFGSCMDIIVDGLALFEKLGFQPPDQASHHHMIGNELQLKETFAYFMREGAAAE